MIHEPPARRLDEARGLARRNGSHPVARKVKVADVEANLADHPTNWEIVKYAKALLCQLA